MKGIICLFVFTTLLCSVLVGGSPCDINISSFAQLQTILSNQDWAPATRILCFGPGDYTPSTTFTITAPQEWRGAQYDTDPTCDRRPFLTPCARLNSARNQDRSVESAFNLTNLVLVIANDDLTIDGFSIASTATDSSPHAIADYNGGTANIYFYNNYIFTSGVAAAYLYEGSLNKNFFESDETLVNSGAKSTIESSSTISFNNNFVYKHKTFMNVMAVHAMDNSFVLNTNVLEITTASSTLSQNFFLQNGLAIGEYYGDSLITSNAFLVNDVAVGIYSGASQATIFVGNCVLDASTIFDSVSNLDVGASTIQTNYVGSNLLVSGGWLSIPSSMDGGLSYSTVAVDSPAVCPRALFTMNADGPRPFILGESSLHIYWSFKFGPSLMKSGLDVSLLNGSTINFHVYDGHNKGSAHNKALPITDTLNFDNNGLATNSLTYTPQYTDFYTAPSHSGANNYTIVASVNPSAPYFVKSHDYIAVSEITVFKQMPSDCKDRTHQIVVPKSQQNSNGGVVTFTLTDLSCPVSTSDWTITSITKQPVHAPSVTVASTSSVSFTIDPSRSGNFSFAFEITSVEDSGITYSLIQHVRVPNTRPVAPNFNQTYLYWTTVAGANILTLTGASDADGDTLTVTEIQARNNGTKIDDHTVYMPEKNLVCEVTSSGIVNLYQPDLTGSSPAKGALITPEGLFVPSFGIHYKVDDGDRVDNARWGTIEFQHIDYTS
eukprot:TRINITY_DN1974_c0_g1_i2.p1 TRINITY_DN1974_c0_g1~~TRINITY_DN1974_c0_g1_i2.p1  ORF type:complete len:720 (+),score=143.46 TRINITY_DN1974_c0_g1_i2:151-2310(+)